MPRATKNESRQPAMPRVAVRVVLSLLIAVHLLGVFCAPLNERMAQSELTSTVTSYLQPYLDAAYLRHGYGFFSPDPGSSIIARYELEMPDGSKITGQLPDLAEHWPRLRYHRHFMLTSQAIMFEDRLPRAYARHLKQATGARRVRLEFVEHRPSAPEEIEQGRHLDNSDTYRPIAIATVDENDVDRAELVSGENIPLPGAPPTFGPQLGGPPPGGQGPGRGQPEELGPLRNPPRQERP